MDEQRRYIHQYHKVYVPFCVQKEHLLMKNLYHIFHNKIIHHPLNWCNFHLFDHMVLHHLDKGEPKNGYFKYFLYIVHIQIQCKNTSWGTIVNESSNMWDFADFFQCLFYTLIPWFHNFLFWYHIIHEYLLEIQRVLYFLK